MSKRSRLLRPFLICLGLIVVAACVEQSSPLPVDPEPVEGPAPVVTDGQWFAYVTVGEDETGTPTLAVDVAEMLTGEEARQKAIEDGVIGEDEDLPNDFYIDNPEKLMDLLQMSEGSKIEVISGDDTSKMLEIPLEQLVALYKGDYVGAPVYGVVPNTPIPMNVTVSEGQITGLSMVYLP